VTSFGKSFVHGVVQTGMLAALCLGPTVLKLPAEMSRSIHNAATGLNVIFTMLRADDLVKVRTTKRKLGDFAEDFTKSQLQK
jgi:hypothetical protein